MIYLITTQSYIDLPPNISLVKCDNLQNWLKGNKRKPLAVDTETEGLDPHSKKIVMLQIGNEEDQFIIDVRCINISFLKPYLESKEYLKLFHNVKFDYKFLLKIGIVCENVYDTMLAEQVLTCGKENQYYSLNALTNNYCDVNLNKEERNKFIGIGSAPFTINQIQYGADDVKYLPLIRQKQIEQATNDELLQVIELENNASLAFADMEYNGIALDSEKWLITAEVNSKELQEKEIELDSIVLTDDKLKEKFKLKYKQADMFTPIEEIRSVNINWNSPTQVLNIFKQIDPKLNNVNGKELITIAHKHNLIKEYIRYKNKSKLVSSYGKKFLNHINTNTNRIHTSFYQILETGRCASERPKLNWVL